MSNHARGLWGYSGETAGGRRADDPGDRDGRAERGAGAGRPGRAGRAAGGAGRHLHGTATRSWHRGSCWRSPRPTPGGRRRRRRRGPARPGAGGAAAGGARRRRPGWPRSPASTPCTAAAGRPRSTTGDVADMQTAALLELARGLGVALAAVLIVAETRRLASNWRRGGQAGGEGSRSRRLDRTLSLRSRVRLCSFFGCFFRRLRGASTPISRLRSSICSSTSSSRWEKERKRRSRRSRSVAEERFRAPIAACWASIAFSRAPKAAEIAL